MSRKQLGNNYLCYRRDQIKKFLFTFAEVSNKSGKIHEGCNFIFDYDSEMHYICKKISLDCGGLSIDSLKRIESKILTINIDNISISENCFQYAVTVVLTHEKTKNVLQTTAKICPFVNQYG